MARGLVVIATPLMVLALSAAAARLTPAAAATVAPPLAAPDTSGSPAWTAVPTVVAPAGREVIARNPTGLNPQPTARQGSNAPPAETRFGSGDGINVDPLGTCVSCTDASAGNNSSSSESRELKVADESLAEGQGPTNGYNGGTAFAIPPNSLLGLALGYFQMDSHADQDASEAHSLGSFAVMRLGDGQMATVSILESRSDATYSAAHGVHRNGSSSGVNGAFMGGQLALVVLHSDSDSSGHGHVYLVQMNDREVASAEQLGGGTPLTIAKVASISLFHVGPDGAVVGVVQDGSSNQAAGIVTSSSDSPGATH
jgi:hypothetical protein